MSAPNPPTVCLCCPAPASLRLLCRACYLAVRRRTERGEPWDDALEDRRRRLDRARRGLVGVQGMQRTAND